MKEINIARTLGKKRREKGVTQEELAFYLGVSKASVSKWETGQSYPDILFLPQLAAYFNISVDELLGYEPQMTKEDIRRLYHRLAGDFACKPFGRVLGECRETVKKYFSCFPLLMQMAVLLMNHCDLADSPEGKEEIFALVLELCGRVKGESGDVALIRTAGVLEASVLLIQQKPGEVAALLEEAIQLPDLGEEALYATALQLQGNLPKAQETLQICLYRHLTGVLGNLPGYLLLLLDAPERFGEGMRRARELCRLFHMEGLHPYLAAQINYTGAYGWVQLGEREKALDCLQEYARLCTGPLFPLELHGDEFFDLIGRWLSEFDLGVAAPRDARNVRPALAEAVLQNPVFSPLSDDPRFRSIAERLAAWKDRPE